MSGAHWVHERVLAYIEAPDAERFEALALDVFRHQFETIPFYRQYCERRGAVPAAVRQWTEIPPVPVEAFRHVELCCGPPQRRFRSTGTTHGPSRRSVHALPDLRLYRASAVAGMARFLFPDARAVRILSLVHSPAELPDSSLAQMVAWAMEAFGAEGSAYAVTRQGIDFALAADALRAAERSGEPLCILATTAALLHLLDDCQARGWSFHLPHGSRLMDTGGAKGAPRLMSRRGLLRAVWNALSIPGYYCVNEYGMAELSSQAYENAIANRVAGRFARRALVSPPWMRTRILEPATLREAAPGEAGLLCHYDLANAGTALVVLTEDIGRAVGEGFEILGRAAGAELRGCSLVWESFRGPA